MKFVERFSWLRFRFRKEKALVTESKIKVCEVDGREVPVGAGLMLVVKNDYRSLGAAVGFPGEVRSTVILGIGGKTYTVSGKELLKAVKAIVE